MGRQVRKFELIETEKTPEQKLELKRLEVIWASASTSRDFFVVAYHYAISGFTAKAENALNRINPTYFNSGLYKDLYFAMLAWNVYCQGSKREDLRKYAEFFIVVQQSMPLFVKLKFNGHAHYSAFLDDYKSIVAFTNGI